MAIGNRRLLRDRPSDGAALVCEKIWAGHGLWRAVGCAGMVSQGCGGNDVRMGARVFERLFNGRGCIGLQEFHADI